MGCLQTAVQGWEEVNSQTGHQREGCLQNLGKRGSCVYRQFGGDEEVGDEVLTNTSEREVSIANAAEGVGRLK